MEYTQLPLVPEAESLRLMIEAGQACRDSTGFYPITFTMMDPLGDYPKDKDFASLIPGDGETYIYGADKEAYYDDYRRSLFAYTWQKAGWDCNRHTEILSCGCVPYMHDIEFCPPYTMFFYPKSTMRQVLDLEGIKSPSYEGVNDARRWRMIEPASIDHSTFDREGYETIRSTLATYSQRYLTPEAQLKYIAGCTGRDHLPEKILCYTNFRDGDYLADSIIKKVNELGRGIEYPKKELLYGHRSSYYYSGMLTDSQPELRTDIQDKIRSRYFDMIIFVDAWRPRCKDDEDFEHLCRQNYDSSDLIYLIGDDFPRSNAWHNEPDRYYFKREIY